MSNLTDIQEWLDKNPIDKPQHLGLVIKHLIDRCDRDTIMIVADYATKHERCLQITNNLCIETTNLINIEMVHIPCGTFLMGSTTDQGYPDEQPIHEVTLNDFYIGKYPITQEQWTQVMGTNPSFNQCSNLHPVETVSWHDVQKFIAKLIKMTGRVYRLPTEAEWEYACTCGKEDKLYSDPNLTELKEIAWFYDNSEGTTCSVGLKLPNKFGLYDMLGNVWEWCEDVYDSKFYSESPKYNPVNNNSGRDRVRRGGSWSNGAQYSRCALRGDDSPDSRYGSIGFRLAMDIK